MALPEPAPADGVRLLLEPRDGVPQPVATDEALSAVVARFAAGTGPVALDAERASGYRYGQAAYLVQLRREGAGTALIDPLGCPDLRELSAVLADAEWVLHAASQDLPCLAELGLRPRRLFDTELAGRLAGLERVGLAAIVESMLGLRLEKGHGAADWSTRPLPEAWLRYATLDVEVLLELRDALEAELAAQEKLDWASQEFAALVDAPATPPRAEPWRRTSGIHRVRSRRQLAAVRTLWQERDELARTRDLAPGRVLPDAAIITAAVANPTSPAELVALPVFGGRGNRRHTGRWLAALRRAAELPETELPGAGATHDGPPPAARWAERDQAAAARLARARAALGALAEQHRLPLENLLAPDSVRRLAWKPPSSEVDPAEPDPVRAVADALRELAARPWQVALAAAPLAAALAPAEPPAPDPTEPAPPEPAPPE